MLSIKIKGLDKLQKTINDLKDPHNTFYKDAMLKQLFDSVPEAVAEKEKLSVIETEKGFKFIFADLTPEVREKVEAYIASRAKVA